MLNILILRPESGPDRNSDLTDKLTSPDRWLSQCFDEGSVDTSWPRNKKPAR